MPSPSSPRCVGHLQLLSVGQFVDRGWIKRTSERSLLLQTPNPVCFVICRVSGQHHGLSLPRRTGPCPPQPTPATPGTDTPGRGSASPRLGSGRPRGLSPVEGTQSSPGPPSAPWPEPAGRGCSAPPRHPALPTPPAAPRGAGAAPRKGMEGKERGSPWLPPSIGVAKRPDEHPGMLYPARFHSRGTGRLLRRGRGGGRVVCACSFVSSNQISFVLQIASIAALCRGQTGSAENN